jgi:hypothetical protein
LQKMAEKEMADAMIVIDLTTKVEVEAKVKSQAEPKLTCWR